jgi:hypothetical protein
MQDIFKITQNVTTRARSMEKYYPQFTVLVLAIGTRIKEGNERIILHLVNPL